MYLTVIFHIIIKCDAHAQNSKSPFFIFLLFLNQCYSNKLWKYHKKIQRIISDSCFQLKSRFYIDAKAPSIPLLNFPFNHCEPWHLGKLCNSVFNMYKMEIPWCKNFKLHQTAFLHFMQNFILFLGGTVLWLGLFIGSEAQRVLQPQPGVRMQIPNSAVFWNEKEDGS